MKNVKTALLVSTSILLAINLFAKSTPYPFEVKVSGHGKRDLIFIPGFACSGNVWNETLAAYESTYTCHTLTMAGFAGVPPEVAPSFSHWEAAIVAYIEQNHIDHPVIIGHSLGGGLALAIAADYPKVPSAIVVVDALPCLAALTNPEFAANPNNDCGATVQRFTSMPDSEFKIMQQRTMPSLVADTSKVGMLVNWSVLSDRRTFATMYCDFMNTDLRNKIKRITCPALILLEGAFAGIKQPIAEQFKNLAAAQLSYANKGLHFIMFDDKDWYLQQLNTFIK